MSIAQAVVEQCGALLSSAGRVPLIAALVMLRLGGRAAAAPRLTRILELVAQQLTRDVRKRLSSEFIAAGLWELANVLLRYTHHVVGGRHDVRHHGGHAMGRVQSREAA